MVVKTENSYSIILQKTYFPLFSIVIPAYNAKDTILSCIDSVLNLTFEDFEIVVVDDCSTDSQWDMLNQLYSCNTKVKLLRNEVNVGSFGSRNKAIVNSLGKYILPLDADDMLFKNALEVLSRQFDDQIDVILFHAKCELAENERYLNIDDVLMFDNVYDMMMYAYKNCKNHNLITKCFRGSKLRSFVKKLPAGMKINMMDDEVELIGLSCLKEINKVKVIQDVLYLYCYGGQSNTFKTYSVKDSENDKNCLALVASFISNLKTTLEKVDIVSNMLQSIINCLTRDEMFFPEVVNRTIQSDVLLEFIFKIFKGSLSDSINKIANTYLKYLVKPVKEHKILTIGIVYQDIAIGGIETFIVNICKMLITMNYNVVLLTNHINEKIIIPIDVKIEYIEKYKWNNEAIIRARINLIKNIICKHKIDLIFSLEYWQTVNLYDFIAANSVDCYYMMCFHNNPCFLFLYRYGRFTFEHTFHCYKHFDLVIALSKEHVKLFNEFGISSTYIPNVVNDELISIAKETRHDFNDDIVWIGRFCQQKNPIDVIYAFHNVCRYTVNSNLRLKLIGSIEDRRIYSNVLHLVHELGLSSKVDFCGEKTNKDTLQYLKNCRLLCYTSKFDGYPYLIAEAMACGIPIIAYNQNDLELFKCCKEIVQCESNDQLNYNTLKVYNYSNEVLQKIAFNEKKCFLEIYDNQQILDIYLNLFKTIGLKNSVKETTFGKMLYRYILLSLKEKTI